MVKPVAPRDGTVQSVDRAISILEIVARHRSIGVTQLALELGLHKTTVFRLLATLESRGLIEQISDRGDYRLGYTTTLLSGAVSQPDLAAICHPLAVELAAQVNETVNVAIVEGRDVITIDQVAGSATVGSIDWVGRRAPLHATAAGKVLLACMAEGQVHHILDMALEQYTPHTIVDVGELIEQLAHARASGLAYCYEEHEIGLVAIGAPIWRLDGTAAAALTVSGPAYRVNETALPALEEAIRHTAERASWRLGSPKRP